MEDELTYFFDSYALIEVYKGSKNYEKYKTAGVVTSYLHVFEVYYSLIKEHSEEEIKDFFETIKNFCAELKFEWIPESAEFKKENKKKRVILRRLFRICCSKRDANKSFNRRQRISGFAKRRICQKIKRKMQ